MSAKSSRYSEWPSTFHATNQSMLRSQHRYELLQRRKCLGSGQTNSNMPEVSPAPARQQTLQETRKIMVERDAEQKSKIKAYAYSKLGTKPSDIKPGDTVLVRQPKKNKLSTLFNPEPLVVKEKKGSMVTASDGLKSSRKT